MFKTVVDSAPELNKPLSAKYKQSFAHPTFLERAPAILDGIIKSMRSTEKEIADKYGKTAVEELDSIIEKIEILKKEMQTDQPLSDIGRVNGAVDAEIQIYNDILKEIRNSGEIPTWFSLPWMFVECYQYRRLNQIFRNSTSLQNYDPFMPSKVETLLSSSHAIAIVAEDLARFKKSNFNETQRRENFEYFLECSLWGNKADLSLSGGKAVTVAHHDPSLKQNILVNHTDQIYNRFLKLSQFHRVVDIVLDNAGFELYNDLCFADFLIFSGLATDVVFHGKKIPWFVSDTTAEDFSQIFTLLKDHIPCKVLHSLVQSWVQYCKSGRWRIVCEPFWVSPYTFDEMPRKDPELYAKLGQSDLLIFKGDLNYRKLVGDIHWDSTVPFKTALRGFLPTNLVALRTIKADTVAGLKPGQADSIAEIESNWLITGKYAVIEFVPKLAE